MQEGAGGEQILVRSVRGAEHQRCARDRQHVFEEAAAIRVMHRQGRGPDAQLAGMLRGDGPQQLAHERILDVRDELLQLVPHLLNGTRRAHDAVFLAETLLGILVGVDAADALDDQLQPAVGNICTRLHLHEFAAVEFIAKAHCVIQDAGFDEAGFVLKHQRNERFAGSSLPHLFLRAQEKRPAVQIGLEGADKGQTRI